MEMGKVTMLLCQSQGSQSISTLSCDCLDRLQDWFLELFQLGKCLQSAFYITINEENRVRVMTF